MKIFKLLVVVVAALALTAVQASAAGLVELNGDSTELHFEGGGTESSQLKVEFDTFVYKVTDQGSALSAGSGCTSVTAQQVTCASTGVVDINLDMNGGYDTLDVGMDSGIPSYVLITARDVGDVTGGTAPLDLLVNEATQFGIAQVMGSMRYDNITIKGVRYNVNGGEKDDQITIENDFVDEGFESTVFASGGPGNDLIDASRSSANLGYEASDGIDILHSSQGNDEIGFGQGQDLIFGNDGQDRFYDIGEYQDGSDLSEVWGGPGDDFFTEMTPQHAEVTHFEGGPGIDTVTYQNVGGAAKPVRINFDGVADDGAIRFGEAEGDHFHDSVENIGNYFQLTGSMQMRGNDILEGSERPNRIFGHNGEDSIDGHGGNDYLSGGGHNDTIDGGSGNDEIHPGVNGDVDEVTCGAGDDVVYAESIDSVASDCETVHIS